MSIMDPSEVLNSVSEIVAFLTLYIDISETEPIFLTNEDPFSETNSAEVALMAPSSPKFDVNEQLSTMREDPELAEIADPPSPTPFSKEESVRESTPPLMRLIK